MSIESLKELKNNGNFQEFHVYAVSKMTWIQYIEWSTFCTKIVFNFYKKKFPNDKKPITAIDACYAFIKNPIKENITKCDLALKDLSKSKDWNIFNVIFTMKRTKLSEDLVMEKAIEILTRK